MGGGRLQEVPNIVIRLGNCKYLRKLVAEDRWSLVRGDCNLRLGYSLKFVCQGLVTNQQ